MKLTSEEIHKLIVGTFETPIARKLLDYLEETIVLRPTYKPGMGLDEVAFREGQKDIINQLLKEMKDV